MYQGCVLVISVENARPVVTRCLASICGVFHDQSYLSSVSIQILSANPRVLQVTSKTDIFNFDSCIVTHCSVQSLTCKCGVTPMLTRYCFTVLSNQNSQGSRGVTTVCLVYRSSVLENGEEGARPRQRRQSESHVLLRLKPRGLKR